MNDGVTNGYIERKEGGSYDGELYVEGVNLSPITGVMFKQNDRNYLWLKRKDKLFFDYEEQRYIKQQREPRIDIYLEKQVDGSTVAYKGEFIFMRFRFSITGVWDSILGRENNRMNFYIDRLPTSKQDIILGIGKWKTKDGK